MNETSLEQTTGVRGNAYHSFLDAVSANFKQLMVDNKSPLFLAESNLDLNAVYLKAVGDTERQEHNCRTCDHFFKNYGNLVHINKDGTLTSAVWANTDGVPDEYKHVADALRAAVEFGTVSGPFYTPVKSKLYTGGCVFGEPEKGTFRHFSVTAVPDVVRSPKEYGEDKTSRTVLGESIKDINIDTVKNAVHAFTHDADLKNRTGFKGALELYLGFRTQLAETRDSRLRSNLIWLATVVAPKGVTRISTTALGEYLAKVGTQPDYARRRFLTDTASDVYQRPVAAPSAGQVQLAEKLVEELGIASALKRRQATRDDIQEWVWEPAPVSESVDTANAGGVFGSVVTKEQEPKAAAVPVNGGTISWVVFLRDILPTASKIRLFQSAGRLNLGGLVTAVDADAKPILKWDSESRRNPVSWYLYNDGIEAEGFNLRSGAFVEVTGITKLPWMWNNGNTPTMSEGMMLVLEGASDQAISSSVLFPVILRNELHPVRATIEAYSNANVLTKVESPICGNIIGKVHSVFAGRTLEVTTPTGVVRVVVNRWE